jgi:hypothetical protein
MSKLISFLCFLLLGSQLAWADPQSDYVVAEAKAGQATKSEFFKQDKARIYEQMKTVRLFDKTLQIERKKDDSDSYGRNYYVSTSEKACLIFISDISPFDDSTGYMGGVRSRQDLINCYDR